MENKFLEITDKNEWQGLLDRVLFKTFFHNIDWEEFLESQFKWLRFERYVYNDSALLSLAKVGNKLTSHPFCEYGGPLPLVERIDGGKFKQQFFSEFKYPARVSFHPHLANFFQNESRTVLDSSERVSYFIEKSFDLRKTTRHEIEKAQTSNLQIGKCQNERDLYDFYDLYIRSVKRHRIPAYPYSFFEYFLHSKESEIVLAKKDNFVIAGSVFLFYDRFIHYFQNASDEKYKNSGANYLILWQEIQKSLAENKVFDFGGTRLGSLLQTFKKGWGGTEHPIYELTNQEKRRTSGLRSLRSVFGLLPPVLIKKISPYLLRYKL